MEGLLPLALIIGIIIVLVRISNNKKKRLRQLKLAYDEALRGQDKKKALIAGRLYYSVLRKDGLLTIFDEQAITNDLSTMTDRIAQ